MSKRNAKRSFYQELVFNQMMAALYDVSVFAINQHLQCIFADNELEEAAVIKQYLITAREKRLSGFLKLWDREILRDAGRVTAEIARAHAESEFEKYRIVQDRLFESDFDKAVKQINTMARSITVRQKDTDK